MNKQRNCPTCDTQFLVGGTTGRKLSQRFCSMKCVRNSGQFDGSQAGESHYEWKGENADYSSKHHWIRKILGKPENCKHCGKANKPGIDGRSTIQWANIDHKYSRNPNDYLPLCYSCHQYYDQGLRQHS